MRLAFVAGGSSSRGWQTAQTDVCIATRYWNQHSASCLPKQKTLRSPEHAVPSFSSCTWCHPTSDDSIHHFSATKRTRTNKAAARGTRLARGVLLIWNCPLRGTFIAMMLW